jgi:hypothetical protein
LLEDYPRMRNERANSGVDTHDVKTADEMGWAKLRNGLLLNAAEEAGFDVLITVRQEHREPTEL